MSFYIKYNMENKIYTYKLLKYSLKLQHILTISTQFNIYQTLPSFLFAHDHIFAQNIYL
jgi:hypothetical protein